MSEDSHQSTMRNVLHPHREISGFKHEPPKAFQPWNR